MHSSEHLELASFLCMHGSQLIAQGEPMPAGPLNRYWSAAKGRWERWAGVPKRFGGAPAPAPRREAISPWPRVRGVIQRILLSDVPTRVWTAVLAASDRQRGVCEAEPVARSILVAQAEARCR